MSLGQLGRGWIPQRRIFLGLPFRLLRKIHPVRERVVLGQHSDYVEREHVVRYEFAKRFCQGKTVADIACGSGYGTEILRQVALTVDGYDKELLCGNYLIDLDTQSWEKSYEIIVSFETIEHLRDPDFFLANVHRTAGLLIVSSPIGEFEGYNPYHLQTWELPEFQALLEKRFDCSYFFQEGLSISSDSKGKVRFVIAVALPKKQAG